MKGQALHEKQTKAFIEQNSDLIVIRRRPRISDGAGGHTWGAEAALPAQTARKVGQGRVGALTERTTEDGAVVVPTAVLVCMPGADIQRFDHFTLGDTDHEVVWVNTLPEWRITAEVVERA